VAAETVLKEFSARFPEVEVEIHPRLDPELIEGVSTHSLDVAVVLAPFRSVDPPPRYQQLSTFELLAIVPEGHRLTELDRVPRRELLQEQLLGWPRNINPEMIDHIHRILFGASDHPQMLYVPELEEARRHERVANGEGIGIAVLPPGMERRAPGVVFLHFEEPTPFINYGVAWSDTQSSPWLHEFLEVASEFADPKVPSGPA
jgi:DNA-binding transcriptional LysR family regulator